MKYIAKVKWGTDSKILLQVHYTLVRLQFDYATYLLPRLSESNYEILQRIQKVPLRIVLGTMRSTPVNVLHAEVCVMSVKHRLDQMERTLVLTYITLEHDDIRKALKVRSWMLRLYRNWKQDNAPSLIKAHRWIRETSIPKKTLV